VGCSRSGDLRSDLPDAQPLLFSKQWRRSRRRKVQIDTLLAREGKGRRMEFDVLALAAKISEERERERERKRMFGLWQAKRKVAVSLASHDFCLVS
jgi:hypothetical protein